MKILLSVNRYPTAEQPFTAFISVLAEELVRQGHSVDVVAPQSILNIFKRKIGLLPFYCEYCVEGNKCVRVYRPKTFKLDRNIFKKISLKFLQLAVSKVCKRIPCPDICYGHFWASAYTILPYAQKNNLPLFVATGEDKILLQHIISLSEQRELYKACAGVICVSTKNKEESVRLGFAQASKCIVFPNSVDPKVFYLRDREVARKRLNISESAFVIAYVGRFNNRKGVMRVAEAIKRLNDDSIKSIFIGGQVEGKKLNPDCKGIIFKGTLNHNQISEYLSAADVFVLPTLAEGCSNSIVEALSCGLPVISSDLPFNHDILHSKNSIMIDPNSIDDIMSAILKIKNNVKFAAVLRTGAIETAKALTIENRVKAIVNFINNTITSF